MRLLCCNVKGLIDPLKQKELSKTVNSIQPVIVGIVENKIKDVNINYVFAHCFLQWELGQNTIPGNANCIWVCWNESVVKCGLLSSHH